MTGSRRLEHKRRTRQALLEAAERLFAEHGFDAVRVEEIAAAAGVSRRSFFRYFPSKEAVAFPRHEGDLARFEAALAAGRDRPAGEALRAAGRALAAAYAEDRETLSATQQLIEDSPALAAADRARDRRWEEVLVSELRARGADPWEAAVRGAALFGAMQAVRREWLRTGAEGDLIERTEAALRLVGDLLD